MGGKTIQKGEDKEHNRTSTKKQQLGTDKTTHREEHTNKSPTDNQTQTNRGATRTKHPQGHMYKEEWTR